MMNKEGKRFRYSNRKHANSIKRFKYQSIIKKYKDKNEITKIENQLSDFNSKTCDIKKFEDFVKNKNTINNLLFDKYNDKIFRKYQWYGYLIKSMQMQN